MARYNTIFAGPFNEYQPQTVEGFVSAASKPGTIVRRGASNALTVGASALGAEAKYYILNEGTLNGLGEDLDTNVETNTTAEAFDIQERQNYNVLLAAGQNITALDTPLTVNTAGTLQVATVGTHEVVFYANEIYNNNTGATQLIRNKAHHVISGQLKCTLDLSDSSKTQDVIHQRTFFELARVRVRALKSTHDLRRNIQVNFFTNEVVIQHGTEVMDKEVDDRV